MTAPSNHRHSCLSADVHQPPDRVLLCLEGCFGEFYLPLDLNERIVCPVDPTHTVAVYSGPCIHGGRDG